MRQTLRPGRILATPSLSIEHVVATFIAAAGLTGCFNEPPQDDARDGPFGKSKQALQDSAELVGEGHSPKAITVRWSDAPASSREAVERLTARVNNTTPVPREAHLVLTARGATGQEDELDLGKVALEAQAETDLDVSIEDLPVQTSGIATAIQIVAHYESPNNVVAGTLLPESTSAMRSASEWRYVTHSDDFQKASVRTNRGEAFRNGELYLRGSLPELNELRSTGSLAAKSATQGSTQMIVSLPHGAIPSPTPSNGEE